MATERSRIERLLSARGLAPVPVLVSETGIFPGTRESTRGLLEDLHIQAAGMASLHYWYAGQPGIVPFDWTIDHPENDRKDLFVDTATGVPRPYCNALWMLSRLPDARFQATSDALDARGTGVYGIAGADSGRIIVMTWNYQWTGQSSHESRIVLSHLPQAFRASKFRVTRYRLSRTMHDRALEPVETFLVPPRKRGVYTGQTLLLGPNEVRLLVLAAQP